MEFSPTALLNLLEKIEFPDDDIATYRIDVLRKTLFKKFLSTVDQRTALEAEAKVRFLANNDRVANLVIVESNLLRYMRDEMHMLVNSDELQTCSITLDKIVQRGYCGPGASVGVSRNTDFLTKMFHSELSHTHQDLLLHYQKTTSIRWKLAEAFRARHHSTSVVRGSSISFVDKDNSKLRTICTEPVLNMFYQLGAKEILEGCLKRVHNLDVSLQPQKNVNLARIGSINQRFATLDLSDASDSISAKLVEAILPAVAYSTLNKIRCTEAKIGGEYHKLGMFSTMGNGFTFPLMTSIFSCLVRSVYRMNGVHPKCGQNYTVFGDDIIVLTEHYDEVVCALQTLGFIPNMAKSFATGNFRESCGGDFYHGYNVRGVYIKELKHEAHFYTSINSLLHWSVRSGIDVSECIAALLDNTNLRFVPPGSPDDSGVIIPYELARVLVPMDNGKFSVKYLQKVSRYYVVGQAVSNNLKMVGSAPRVVRRRSPHAYVKSLSERPINIHGSVIAAVGGYLREQEIILREDKNPKYKVRKKTVSIWNDCNDSFNESWLEFSPRLGRRGAWYDMKIHTKYRTFMEKTQSYFGSSIAELEACEALRRSLDRLTLMRLEALIAN